eukprot:TRINITY_DN61063_c0_g1_i1.p1 TRINITY_DN61063_c0_g1~~TRINITY_DN61063_c0_g1_i1.p1  ORF type:complete len:507 (+),score=26.25 TRINITY_DN61063_c0_g1_i1:194-1714(+)
MSVSTALPVVADDSPPGADAGFARRGWESSFIHRMTHTQCTYRLVAVLGSGTYGAVWLARVVPGVECSPPLSDPNAALRAESPADKFVAVKVPNPTLRLNDGQTSGHVLREVQTLQRSAHHPNVVALVGVDAVGPRPLASSSSVSATSHCDAAFPPAYVDSDGRGRDPALIFEYISGCLHAEIRAAARSPLSAALSIASGPSPLASSAGLRGAAIVWISKVCGYVRGIATALAALHASSVVHRDLKPANVLLAGPGLIAPPVTLEAPAETLGSGSSGPPVCDLAAVLAGRVSPPSPSAAATGAPDLAAAACAAVRLADFGLARGFLLPMPAYDAEVQTLHYRAPERLVELPAGPAMDVWSCGCILAEGFAGQPVMRARSAHATEASARFGSSVGNRDDGPYAPPFVGAFGVGRGVTLSSTVATQCVAVETVVGDGGPPRAGGRTGWLYDDTAVWTRLPILQAVPPSAAWAMIRLLRTMLAVDPQYRPTASAVSCDDALICNFRGRE